ncbi:MAG: cytochrome c [Alphaproteobacteria bacterium]
MAAGAIAVTMVAAGSFSAAESTGEGLIKYRQSVMGALGAHMGAISRIVRGEADHPDQLLAHAQAVQALAMMIPEAFADNAEGAENEAKPEIWSDAAGFAAKAEALQTAAADFVAAAETGDMAAAGAALGGVGGACKGCHDNYREAD